MNDDSAHPRGEEADPVETAQSGPMDSEQAELDGPQITLGTGDRDDVDPGAESDVWTGRTHWKHYSGRLILWVIGGVALFLLLRWVGDKVTWLTPGRVFWVAFAVFAAAGLVIMGRVVLRILSVRYRLTTQRLFIERGILSQTIDQMELIRVDDVRLHKSLLDRLFGLGTVAIRSTDSTDQEVVIEGISEPDHVAETIRTRMRVMRRKSLFVENL